MPPKSPDACFYVTEPPEFDYREGLFHITVEVGGLRTERVCKPHVFMLGLRRAAECAKKHKFGGADILPFTRAEEDVA